MRTRSIGIVVTIVLISSLCAAQKQLILPREDKFQSPDKTIIALVRFTRTMDATNESRVELRTQNGRVLVKHDYGSEDGEHGYGVRKAAWTPDSQYFVYSLESSGGHSAWHSPVQFFSRARDKIVSLDDALNDAVTNPQFLVTAPDNVTVELWFSKQTKTVSLSHLPRP
jgi:hypothetical protein